MPELPTLRCPFCCFAASAESSQLFHAEAEPGEYLVCNGCEALLIVTDTEPKDVRRPTEAETAAADPNRYRAAVLKHTAWRHGVNADALSDAEYAALPADWLKGIGGRA